MALFGFRKKEKKFEEKDAQKKRAERLAKEPTSSGESNASAKQTVSHAPSASTGRSHAAVLVRPRITEKATFAAERGAYVFDVMPSATKTEIKEAIQHYYKVTPRKVNIVTIPQKMVRSRIRGRFGTVASGKKAYVYLKDGDTIEVV